jgi:hypothetical protein
LGFPVSQRLLGQAPLLEQKKRKNESGYESLPFSFQFLAGISRFHSGEKQKST